MDNSLKPKVALVFPEILCLHEINQFSLLSDQYDFTLITSEEFSRQVVGRSLFDGLGITLLPVYDQNKSYLPGLDHQLANKDIVVVKGRNGIYSYQIVKAKWRHKFRLFVLEDDVLGPGLLGEDQSRTINEEINNCTDQFLVHSNSVKASLVAQGIHEDKISTFISWVDSVPSWSVTQKEEARRELMVGRGDLVVGIYGSLSAKRAANEVFMMVQNLLREPSLEARRLKFVIYGSGKYINQLKKDSVRLGFDSNLIFLSQEPIAYQAFMNIIDVLYLTRCPNDMSLSGSHYPVLIGMECGIPILSTRTPSVEETAGKDRLDYCLGSCQSLVKAIKRSYQNKKLIHNIVEKNKAKVKAEFNRERSRISLQSSMNTSFDQKQFENHDYDKKVRIIEGAIATSQYLSSIDMIEHLLKDGALPSHHRGNLMRLVGDCFVKLGDGGMAKKSYIDALEVDKYNYKAHIGLGTISLTKENFDVAIIHFQKAVALAPNDEMSNLGMGMTFQGLEELEQASKWIVKALKINPTNLGALFSLVKIAYEENIFEVAETHVRKYLECHPYNIDMIFALGGLCYKTGKYEETIELMSRIQKEDFGDKRSLGLLRKAKRCLLNNSQIKG